VLFLGVFLLGCFWFWVCCWWGVVWGCRVCGLWCLGWLCGCLCMVRWGGWCLMSGWWCMFLFGWLGVGVLVGVVWWLWVGVGGGGGLVAVFWVLGLLVFVVGCRGGGWRLRVVD
ncbi:hypothetical protein, partial [Pseudomonas syringae group genomosp. 7]|uniref:hypothetical protein n=1 Tax=Pseudomonas syringae group genomosp. 7 TaxID=251699 RepID=UPI0037700C93